METLTSDIEGRICEEIAKIDDMGGMFEAVNSGYVQKEIMQLAVARQRDINTGERVWVGVNKYVLETEGQRFPSQVKVDPEQIDILIERTRRLRRERNQEDAKKAVTSLRRIAETGDGNIFEAIMEAVSAFITQGEIIKELREVFGFGRPDVFY